MIIRKEARDQVYIPLRLVVKACSLETSCCWNVAVTDACSVCLGGVREGHGRARAGGPDQTGAAVTRVQQAQGHVP